MRFTKGQSPWNKGLKGIHLSPSSEFKKGQKPSKETKAKQSEGLKRFYAKNPGKGFFKKGVSMGFGFKKGRLPWNKGRKMSDYPRCGFKVGNKPPQHVIDNLARIARENKGEKNINWKGGVTPKNTIIRKSKRYKVWQISVFERDNYKCVECGAKSMKGAAVILNADHIKPFAYFPELRFETSNGRTLCVDCHKQTDTYGYKGKNYTYAS